METLVKELAIKTGPTGRFLVRAAAPSAPFIWKGDTAWELFHRLNRDEAIHYLDNRAARGFNVVLAVALTELDTTTPFEEGQEVVGPGAEVVSESAKRSAGSEFSFLPNRQGDLPLHDNDPARPNERYFAHIDWVVGEAAKRGLLVCLVPTWSRWMNMGWHAGPIIFDEAKAASYGHFIGSRYPFLPKIVGGDTNPYWVGGRAIFSRYAKNGRAPDDLPLPTYVDLPVYDTRKTFDAMGTAIRAAEQPAWDAAYPGQSAFLTYHPTALWLPQYPEARASAYFNDAQWLTMDGVQSGHADFPNLPFEPPLSFWDSRAPHVPISHMWQNTPTRPALDLEGHYEALHNALNAKTGWMWDEHHIRNGAWQSMLSGAVGYVYGANSVWQMYDPSRAPEISAVCGLPADRSWKNDINLPGPSYLPHLYTVFESLPAEAYHARIPAQHLLVSSTSEDDRDRRVTVTCDSYLDSRSSTFLFAHSGKGNPFKLDLRGFKTSKLSLEWLNPRTGKLEKIENSAVTDVATRGQVAFTPPTHGSLEQDWVLKVYAI